jgi:hypothetical protein
MDFSSIVKLLLVLPVVLLIVLSALKLKEHVNFVATDIF